MAMPDFTMRQLLEAGVHFGHHTRRWNPRMAPFLYGTRNQVHIIDLQQTVPMLDRALRAVRDVTAAGGRVLFVGTKRAAAEHVAEAAKRCGQYYVNHRWLGGTLTNWKTITGSIKRLRQIEDLVAGDTQGLTKKEVLDITRDKDKLDRALGGIKDMGGLPDILFIIDTNKEKLAVEEANKLHIPVVAVLDSNSDPTGVTFPIPGNDDAIRAITLYCDLVAGAVLDGISAEMAAPAPTSARAKTARPRSLAEADAEAARPPEPAFGEANDGRDYRRPGEGPARQDRRGHDGLQEGADRDRAATSKPRSTGCARRASPPPPRSPAVSPPRAWSASPPRPARPRSSRSTPKPTSSPATRPSRTSSRTSRRSRWRSATTSMRSRPRRFPAPAARSREELTHLVATIGENMNIRRAKVLTVSQGVVATYMHQALRPVSARSACWRRSKAPANSRRWRRSAARSACTSPPRGRRRSTSTRSIRRRWSAERRC